MIHDAKAEVTCDGARCLECVTIDLPFVYGGTMHAQGHYDHDDEAIEKILQKEHGWICEDGKQYCSEDCKDSP